MTPTDGYRRAAEYVRIFLESDASPECKAQVKKSLEIVNDALSQYSLNELGLSFNGGKDCLVMVILILAQMYNRYGESKLQDSISSVYVKVADPFPQVDQFVDECAKAYPLQIHAHHMPMKEALTEYLKANPGIKAIYVGIRRADPYGQNLDYIQRTDHGWPDFMRIHPVLEWTYGQVWEFLRVIKVPYCSLYDLGYTSLGGVSTTVRNPDLSDTNDEGTYKPAYMLLNESRERVGRF